MARYLTKKRDTLNQCTLPPRVRFEPESVVGPPSLTIRARKRKFARRATVF